MKKMILSLVTLVCAFHLLSEQALGACSATSGYLLSPMGLTVTANGSYALGTSDYYKTVNSYSLQNCVIGFNAVSTGSLGLGKGKPLAVAVSNDQQCVAVYSNSSTGSSLDLFQFNDQGQFIAPGPNQPLLIASSGAVAAPKPQTVGPIQSIAIASSGAAPTLNTQALAITSDKSILALSNYPGNQIRLYSFITGSNTLNPSPLQIIPITKPAAVRFSPDNQFLFILSSNNLMHVFRFNGEEFIRMQLGISTAGTVPFTFALSSNWNLPNERYVAINNSYSSNVAIFRFDETNGSLTLIQSSPITPRPNCISFGPNDDRLAVGTTSDLKIFAFNKVTGTINATPLTFNNGGTSALSYNSAGCLALIKRISSAIEVFTADCQ